MELVKGCYLFHGFSTPHYGDSTITFFKLQAIVRKTNWSDNSAWSVWKLVQTLLNHQTNLKNKYFSLYCYISFTKVISYQSVGIKLEIITIRVPANRKTTRDESNCFEVYSTSLELLVPDDSLQFAGLVISFQNSKVIAILFVNHRIQFGHFHMSLNQQTNFQGTAKTYFLRDTLVPENFLNFQPGQLISSNSIG